MSRRKRRKGVDGGNEWLWEAVQEVDGGKEWLWEALQQGKVNSQI